MSIVQTRAELAAALLYDIDSTDTDYMDDHEIIADALRAGEPADKILSMDEVDRWPETYAWLKAELENEIIASTE